MDNFLNIINKMSILFNGNRLNFFLRLLFDFLYSYKSYEICKHCK